MESPPFGDSYGANPAESYERFFVPVIGAPAAIAILDRAALRPGERVLDVACGTGIVARLATRRVGDNGSVVGLDVNPGMLAVARSIPPTTPAIEWHEAPAETMPLPDDSFDVAFCQMSLQFMEDRPAALREMRRVLAPGGRALLGLPGPASPVFEILEQAIGRHVGGEAAGFVSQVFSLHDLDEIRTLLEGAGFRDVAVSEESKRFQLPPADRFLWEYVHSTPLAATVPRADEETLAALEREVVQQWAEIDAGAQPQRFVIATGWK